MGNHAHFFMSNKLVIVDGNSVGYACHYGNVIESGGMQVQAIVGFINYIVNRKLRYHEDSFVVLWDGRAKWRFELYPEYKGNRSSDDPKKEESKEAYKAQIPLLREFLSVMGVAQVCSRSHEADDLAGLVIASQLSKPICGSIELLTSDKDWVQFVKPNVTWRDFRTNRTINNYTFKQETGFNTVTQFLDAKCLIGDRSDNISGVAGFGEKRTAQFFERFASVEQFFEFVDKGEYTPQGKFQELLASPEGRAVYQRNKQLMDLSVLRSIDPADFIVFDTKQNPERFYELCGTCGCFKLANQSQQILQAFGG